MRVIFFAYFTLVAMTGISFGQSVRETLEAEPATMADIGFLRIEQKLSSFELGGATFRGMPEWNDAGGIDIDVMAKSGRINITRDVCLEVVRYVQANIFMNIGGHVENDILEYAMYAFSGSIFKHVGEDDSKYIDIGRSIVKTSRVSVSVMDGKDAIVLCAEPAGAEHK